MAAKPRVSEKAGSFCNRVNDYLSFLAQSRNPELCPFGAIDLISLLFRRKKRLFHIAMRQPFCFVLLFAMQSVETSAGADFRFDVCRAGPVFEIRFCVAEQFHQIVAV